jgi:Na+/H+ antiporter NhaD/arsenite permease-like protein
MRTAVAVGAFALVYLLLVSERVERLLAAAIGAAAVLLFGVVGVRDAFFSESTGVDWSVLVLLFSMMVIVGGLRRTGALDVVALRAVVASRGSVYRLLVLVTSVTALSAMFLSDVTTVVLLAPVILLICDRLSLAPVPFLIAIALAANLGGSASLVGDPAVIIVGTRADLSFVDVLVHQLPVSLVAFLAFLVIARWLLVPAISGDGGHRRDLAALESTLVPTTAIRDRRMLFGAVGVVAFVVLGFLTQGLTGLEPSVVALLGAGAMWLVVREGRQHLLDHVEWETLAFLAALFVVVGALVKVGAIDQLAVWVGDLIGGSPTVAVLGMLTGSAFVSAIVDNIPFVTTMSPVVADLSAADPSLNPGNALWYALAMGAVLGGNATAIGASTNIVVIGIAKRHGHPIGFWTFTRYGVVVAVLSVAIALVMFWTRYLI